VRLIGLERFPQLEAVMAMAKALGNPGRLLFNHGWLVVNI
jgi:hypothetical protein